MCARPARAVVAASDSKLKQPYDGVAACLDKILRGAKPAELPIRLPTRFDSVIKLRSAQALGLTIPPSVLAQATAVIKWALTHPRRRSLLDLRTAPRRWYREAPGACARVATVAEQPAASAGFALRDTSMDNDNPLAEQVRSLTERIREWYERTPRARRAYEQLSADVDTLAARVSGLVNETEVLKELRDRIAAAIDPQSSSQTDTPAATASGAASDAADAAPGGADAAPSAGQPTPPERPPGGSGS
jgi:hypothetical protein